MFSAELAIHAGIRFQGWTKTLCNNALAGQELMEITEGRTFPAQGSSLEPECLEPGKVVILLGSGDAEQISAGRVFCE
jgi:hypothetical protein